MRAIKKSLTAGCGDERAAAPEGRGLAPVDLDEAIGQVVERDDEAAVRGRASFNAEVREDPDQRVLVRRDERALVQDPLEVAEELELPLGARRHLPDQ
jgi:hypothetical protein